MSDHTEDLMTLLKVAAADKTLQKAVFSGARQGGAEFSRVTVRPIEARGQWMLQFSSQTATQEFHRNLSSPEAATELQRLAMQEFRNVRLVIGSTAYEARISRKGKCFLRREKLQSPVPDVTVVSHNRSRNYLIPEGVPCPFLIHTGVMTSDGTIRSSHSRKFAQINRYLEFISDITDQLPTDRTIQVIDFGCGKSYLTFATQYLLSTLQNRRCRIIGLDRRQDVVQTCNRVAAELKLTDIEFLVGDIAGFQCSTDVDLVISLHACDKATDEALAQAVRWKSRAILTVPCCQHEMNQHLKDSALAPLTHYGLTKERFASLSTDSMRAALMTAAGYPTQILEFIDMEHTPKNLLLRSVCRTETSSPQSKHAALQEVLRLRALLGIGPLALERRLSEWNLLPGDLPADMASQVSDAAASGENSARGVLTS